MIYTHVLRDMQNVPQSPLTLFIILKISPFPLFTKEGLQK
jgi:hypothetical protein